jgi:hypothetical protein
MMGIYARSTAELGLVDKKVVGEKAKWQIVCG